jgi:hypothetical protein
VLGLTHADAGPIDASANLIAAELGAGSPTERLETAGWALGEQQAAAGMR